MAEQLLYCAAAGFEAARRLESLPEGHRARRLHGHSFVARARVAAPEGWAGFPGGEARALRERLARCVAPLDYALLNERLASPTDEGLARWIRERLALAGIEALGVQSAPGTGAELDRAGRAYHWRRYAFESAHRLPNVPPGHKCGRMHGHRFQAVLRAAAPGADHDRLDALWAPLARELDGACLNDIEGLGNPTSEVIASWIWARLVPVLPELTGVTVHETASCGAHFDGARFRIWKEFALDSALRLAGAPHGDARRRIHGRNFALRLHLSGPLDAVLGWTVDFGAVKERFAPVFERLDHQPLYELPGVGDNDLASLLRWIRREAAAALPALERIDLYENPGCGAILAWGEQP
ncbi:MAG: 6-carboxytetrahydropterin synthase [Betaproteobacteria bacterium]|nr:6-carboxytetrahydropterin synthase [Betaproteobacteria bacterium]